MDFSRKAVRLPFGRLFKRSAAPLLTGGGTEKEKTAEAVKIESGCFHNVTQMEEPTDAQHAHTLWT